MKSITVFERDQDRAVSPVIGVILMVAITVILAAVIGAFVLGLGESIGNSQAPTVSTSMSADSDYPASSNDAFYISHTTGESIEMEEFRLVIRDNSGQAVATFDSSNTWASGQAELHLNGEDTLANIDDMTFDAGSTITIHDTDTSTPDFADDEYTIQVVHRGSGTTVSENTVSF